MIPIRHARLGAAAKASCLYPVFNSARTIGARIVILACALSAMHPAMAYSSDLPADAGLIDVRRFGAVGDGRTDDTLAIQRAIDSVPVTPGRTFWHTPMVFFPPGTYLVSDVIDRRNPEGQFTSGMVLKGAGRNLSTLRLVDGAEGYGDPEAPKPVVMTSARLLDGTPTSGNKDYINKGEGNDAYANYIEDLTIDVGAANPGAIALDYLANNVGAVRRVDLVGREGSGAVGLAMTRKWIGPALISDVSIQGFDRGVDIASTEYGITMANIRIADSRLVGLRNAGNLVAADHLEIASGHGPAIQNTDGGGLIVLSKGALSGSGSSAIQNSGYLTLSEVSQQGFDHLVGDRGAEAGNELTGPDNLSAGPTNWTLPVADPPPFGEAARTASVADFGALADPSFDSTQAIQAAFASGADTIVFPYGTYMITRPIVVPESVVRVRGMFAALTVGDRRALDFDRLENGMFVVATSGEPLSVDKLSLDMTDRGGQLGFEFRGDRTLVLEDIVTAGVNLMRRRVGGGALFVSNACCGNVILEGSSPAWFRQFNSEAPRSVRLTNRGAPVRVLGMKVEQQVTVVANSGGGTTEVAGGFFYPVVPGDQDRPLVINDGGRVALAYVEEAFRPDAVYSVHLESQGRRRLTYSQALPKRNAAGARIVPQMVDVTP